MESFGKLVLGTSQPPGTVGREGLPEGSPSLSISCTVSQRVGLYTISAFVGLPALPRILGLRSVVLSLWAEDTALLSEGGRFWFFHCARNVVLLAAHTGRGRRMLVATATDPVVFPVLCGGDSAAVWVVWPPPALQGRMYPTQLAGAAVTLSYRWTLQLSGHQVSWSGAALGSAGASIGSYHRSLCWVSGEGEQPGRCSQRLAMNHHLPGEGLLRKEEHEAGWQKKPTNKTTKESCFWSEQIAEVSDCYFCFLVFWLYWSTLKYWVTCCVLHKMF